MKNCWLIRPIPNGVNRMKDFLDKNLVAIGYPVGISFKGMSNEEIRKSLGAFPEGVGNCNIFVNGFNIDDFVIVPDDNKRDVYFGVIKSDYCYEKTLEIEGYPHQRKVEWLFDKKPIFRSSLPEGVRGSLRYPGIIADLTKHRDVIEDIIQNEGLQEKGTTKSLSNIESEALKVLQDLLRSESEEIRLKASEIILMSRFK